MKEKFQQSNLKEGSKAPEQERVHSPRWKKLVTAGAIILTLGSAACGTPNAEDIARDREKIEVISNQLSYLIEARKSLVKKYNELLDRSQREPDNIELEKSKSQVFDAIKDYDKQINKLSKQYIKKTKQLDSDIVDAQNGNLNPKQPIDENKYDYLLNMIN